MGQFKPMVKMMTTEPTVELKLKKGGHVNMKKGGKAEASHKKMAMGGGAMDMMAGTPALVGRPAVNAPVRAPGKPSMASRRKAMMAKKPAMAKPAMPMGNPSMPAPMKKGGESKATHKAEMTKMKGLEKELKSHESKPASKGHKGLKSGGMATGGVTNGQGGYAKGGIINTEGQGGAYRNTKMNTAKPDHSPATTGGVKNGNGGGYATGGVTKSNAGGYKMGGKASKKAYATGGTVDTGKPVAMPQGAKKPSTPVSINQLSGTFKSGGKVTPAQGRLRANFKAENATAMKQAKADSNLKYSKYQKMKDGGSPTPDERFFDKNKVDPKSVSDKASRELEDAMNPLGMAKDLGRHIMRSFDPEGYFKGDERKKLFESQSRNILADKIKADRAAKGQGAITETERSVTVSPAGKKRGGRAC